MSLLLTFAFLFFVGSVSGWVLELVYRNLHASKPAGKWINPGFCTGPYLPIYGCGLCVLYLIANLDRSDLIADPFWSKVVILLIMAFCMTAIEYIAGVFSLHYAKVRLWDYSSNWGNIQGIICPKFSLIWAVLGGVYYFLIHPQILKAVSWLSNNLAFSFVIGMFFGIFLIDLCHSAQVLVKLKTFAQDNDVVIRYEFMKAGLRQKRIEAKQKYNFFFSLHTERPLTEHLNELKKSVKDRKSIYQECKPSKGAK